MQIKFALAGLAIALAAPAAADDDVAKGAQAPSVEQKAPKAKSTKYCIQYESLTGSRVRRSECLTKSEWADRGVDVDEVLRK